MPVRGIRTCRITPTSSSRSSTTTSSGRGSSRTISIRSGKGLLKELSAEQSLELFYAWFGHSTETEPTLDEIAGRSVARVRLSRNQAGGGRRGRTRGRLLGNRTRYPSRQRLGNRRLAHAIPTRSTRSSARPLPRERPESSRRASTKKSPSTASAWLGVPLGMRRSKQNRDRITMSMTQVSMRFSPRRPFRFW